MTSGYTCSYIYLSQVNKVQSSVCLLISIYGCSNRKCKNTVLFSYVYGKTIFHVQQRLYTFVRLFNLDSFIFLSTSLCVSIFVPKIEQEKEEPVSISFLSHKLCWRVQFYAHLACSLDLSKAELMLWIQKYDHIFSHGMEQPWFSYHFLHCFQLQLQGFLPSTGRLLLIP